MNVEKAYQHIADEMLAKVGDRDWEKLEVKIEIFDNGTNFVHSFYDKNGKHSSRERININVSMLGNQAVLFLRDNILKTRGDRIWGMVYSLNSDGSFNIDYKYDKQNDYEGL